MRSRGVLAAAVLAVAACARSAGVPAPDTAPARSPADAGLVLLLGLELPEAGTVIGGRFGGVGFDVRQSSYQLSNAVRERWSLGARSRGEVLMREAGLRVRSAGPSSSDAQQILGVQYGLAGKVTNLTVRASGQEDAPLVDAQADVAWELLDLGSGSAVFGRSLQGGARMLGTVDDVVAHALDRALERLLADPLFLRALAAPRADPDEGAATRFVRELPEGSTTIELSEADLNPAVDTSTITRIAAGVVAVRSEERVLGTAFTLTRDGLALAVGHTVRHARHLRVRLPSGVERPARVLRTHGGLDVALIQIACPGDCPTVDWFAPAEVEVFTSVLVIGAPFADDEAAAVTFGRVGGRWGLASGVTLEGAEGLVGGGEPVARIASGKVFALVSGRRGRAAALLLSEALEALHVRAPEGRRR